MSEKKDHAEHLIFKRYGYIYQEKVALEVEEKIRSKYYVLLENLYKNLNDQFKS